ncbi:LacI family DNA-binding transcriptional regulator [Erysipelothrix urinaevulpis]|uniref:LacI family DNA-binding transcriptional regulator n=1 Tax=Erysipelothrix urinaevulpis TaxID=2683717 RepID=UPI00135B0EC9|nr:LacI family DNA-binding transcriptional regulator [Erysipelothrix urinaevulpis]
MKVTMKDIAKEADVSITTVSLVLNHKPGRVSNEKRQEILDIAKAMNYVPNLSAKQLVTQKSNSIGIVVPDLENYFFATLVTNIQNSMRDKDIFVMIAATGDKVDQDLKGIELLVSRGVDLIVLAVSNEAANQPDRYLQKFSETNTPIIMVDRIIDEYDGTKIQYNDAIGMYKLTNHVLSKQHTKIAYIKGDRYMLRNAGRTEGFVRAMQDQGINVSNDQIYEGNFSYESGYELFDTIYNQHHYTAIIAANDMMAYGLLKRANERNIKIPDDISITGYDNVIFSEMLTPSLTTVNQNMVELNDELIRLIMIQLDNPHHTETIILNPELVIRNSVKKQ